MLYLIRHGQTEWNRQKMLQGRSDIPLNENGRQMAREAAMKYQDVHFDICYCSPLCRAKETAEIFLAGRQMTPVYDDRLVEICFGKYEHTTGFKEEGHPLYTLFNFPADYVPVGGSEAFDDLFARTGAFLKEQAAPLLREGKDVLIVGHGGMLLSILNRVRNVPLAQFWDTLQRNCELQALENTDVLRAVDEM